MPKPLKPHVEKGVVVVRVPEGTPYAEGRAAIVHMRNLAAYHSVNYAWKKR